MLCSVSQVGGPYPSLLSLVSALEDLGKHSSRQAAAKAAAPFRDPTSSKKESERRQAGKGSGRESVTVKGRVHF